MVEGRISGLLAQLAEDAVHERVRRGQELGRLTLRIVLSHHSDFAPERRALDR
jgi:hypothetical protein